jgi:5'-nucleotidase
MPNDAKLAMVIGVGLVVAVAIVFFHKDLVGGRAPEDKAPTNEVNSPAPPPGAPGSAPRRPLTVRPTGLAKSAAEPRRHTVAEGDTLYDLAERYYGDGDRFTQLYRANRAVLNRPDRLAVGTVLVIPDLSEVP